MKNEDKIYLTKEGLESLMEEINHINELIAKNGRKKSSAYESAVGDGWHDNFEFEDAVREERRLMELLKSAREKLNRVVIVEKTTVEELVNVGDFVRCEFISGDNIIDEKIIHLVGSNKPNFNQEYTEITINSPVGKAIYNKPVGSTVNYSVGNKSFTLNIKEKVFDNKLGR